MAEPGMLWEPLQSLLTPFGQCPGNAPWLCTCPTMNACYYCLKEPTERISAWTPLWYQLRWAISNRVYPIFLEMSSLTLIPGRPGPPSCPRSPAGPLGPGGPGLPRSPAGPWKEMWRFTAISTIMTLPIQIHMDAPKVWRTFLEEGLYLFTWKSIATG